MSGHLSARRGKAVPRQLPRAAATSVVPVGTRLLAELLTDFHTLAGTMFAGDVDRAMVFALFLNIRLSPGGAHRAVSINSAAMSLGRPFETVRRHVNALLTLGLCQRDRKGVRAAPYLCADRTMAAAMDRLNDIVVRYVDDAMLAGLVTPPATPAPRAFDRDDGVRSAIDMTLGMADQHRALLPDATDLAIVYAVLAAAGQPLRVATVARLFGIAESTLRRRAATLAAPGGPLQRCSDGLLVTRDWIARLDAAARAEGRHGTLALGIARISAAGFPFDAPGEAYRRGRPMPPVAMIEPVRRRAGARAVTSRRSSSA